MRHTLAIVLLAGFAATAMIGALNAAPKDKKPAAAAEASAVEKSVTTPGPRFEAASKISTARGEQVFVEYCAVCHGLHGKGDGPRSAFFSDVQYIPDLTLEGFLTGRESEVLNGIREGLARFEEPAIVMPQFKYILSETDIRSAFMYVQTLSKPPAPAKK